MTAVSPDTFGGPAGFSADSGRTQEPVVITPEIGWAWVFDGIRRYLGYILLAAGFLCLFLGWYGASDQSIVAKQIPYLASGGLVGVALVVLGGRVLLIDDLRRDSGRLDRLELMVQELHTLLLDKAPAQPLGGGLDVTGPLQTMAIAPPTEVTLKALAGGTTYHVAGCPMIVGKRASTVTPASVTKRGLTRCPMCDPPAVA